MTTPSRDPEPLGGADAAPKTTYVVGSGTEPEAQASDVRPRANGALTSLLVTAVLIAVVAALVVFR